MNRNHLISALCLGAMTAGMAQAASFEESVISQLRSQGYKGIKTEQTLLGRIKIVAKLNGGRREIILNPRTGEILRDLWIPAEGKVRLPGIIASDGNGNGGGQNGGGGSDDDDGGGDDGGGGGDSDDEDDGDNSGSGNSGDGDSDSESDGDSDSDGDSGDDDDDD